jgi:hypothetical protein
LCVTEKTIQTAEIKFLGSVKITQMRSKIRNSNFVGGINILRANKKFWEELLACLP